MRILLMLTGVSGFLSVALGAFGAHGLKQVLSPDMMAVFQTGVHYQITHTLAALAALILFQLFENQKFLSAAKLYLFGIVLFSGSLYVMTLSGLRMLGMVTPVGGLLLLVAWAMLVLGAFQIKVDK